MREEMRNVSARKVIENISAIKVENETRGNILSGGIKCIGDAGMLLHELDDRRLNSHNRVKSSSGRWRVENEDMFGWLA